jgi:hypothetical protein
VPQPGGVRVVLSSTPDLQPERDELVAVVLPDVRQLAEKRGLVWAEDAEDAEGATTVLLGLLGQRYGWVSGERELVQDAVNGSAPGTVFFYLRDMAWVDSLPLSQRTAYVETPTPEENALLGQVAAGMVSAGRRAQLEELKASARSSGHPVRDFTDAASLAALVRDDLLALVDELAP